MSSPSPESRRLSNLGDLAGALAFLGGGVAMVFTFVAVIILATSAFAAAASRRGR